MNHFKLSIKFPKGLSYMHSIRDKINKLKCSSFHIENLVPAATELKTLAYKPKLELCSKTKLSQNLILTKHDIKLKFLAKYIIYLIF